MRFILNGCDIYFTAEAPADITLEQLIKQCDRIHPDWCACGICSCDYGGYNFSEESEPDIVFDYDNVKKTSDDVPCRIEEE